MWVNNKHTFCDRRYNADESMRARVYLAESLLASHLQLLLMPRNGFQSASQSMFSKHAFWMPVKWTAVWSITNSRWTARAFLLCLLLTITPTCGCDYFYYYTSVLFWRNNTRKTTDMLIAPIVCPKGFILALKASFFLRYEVIRHPVLASISRHHTPLVPLMIIILVQWSRFKSDSCVFINVSLI